MKKTKLKFVTNLLLIFFISTSINAQEDVSEYSTYSTQFRTFNKSTSEIKGSSYTSEEYLPAKITGQSKLIGVKYDAYLDEMEFEKDDNKYHLLKTENLTVEFVPNKKYKVYNFNNKLNYYIVAFESANISLLVKESVILIDAVKAKTGYDEDQPAKYKRLTDRFYMVDSANKITLLPKKKKEFLKLFNSNSKEIESFAKKNKLSFKKKKDLIEIVKYYNDLI